MSEKLSLREKIQAVDQNFRDLWDLLDDEGKKDLKKEFFILNRYVSSAARKPREVQEHFVIMVNERFNKHWANLQAHPKLLWLLLCSCSYDGSTKFYHEWIGYKKRSGSSDNKKRKFLELIYPDKKNDEIDLLIKLNSDKDLKDLANQYGFDDFNLDKK